MRLCCAILFCIFYSHLNAQFVTPRKIVQLPDTVFESSGLYSISPNRIYTHNDSGDQPRFFLIDTLGNILRTIYLSQATATDFEDITRDKYGNMYVGDFGNNLNTRTNLKIYKTGNPELFAGDSIPVEVIHFNYPDQFDFPPAAESMNFDCEGFFWFQDSLYIFSKNRGVSEYSRMYRLPSQPGNYTAQLVDSFYTGKWITSAALNPSATAFVLLSNAQIWLYTNFTGSAFSQANAVKLEMDSTQKEGITFINDTAVYISDERFWGIGGNLYYLSLGNWIPKTPEPSEFSVQVINNPSSTELNLTINGSASYKVEVFNCLGKLVDVKLLSGGYQLYKLHRNDVGILYARITAENGQVKVCSAMLY